MFDLNKYLEGVIRKDTSSAMSSLLWINALITLPCLIGSFLSDGAFRYCLFSLAVLIALYTLIKYEFWSKRDPRKLMSEKTQIEMIKLDIIQEKGGDIKFDIVDIPLGEDPRRLESKGEAGQ